MTVIRPTICANGRCRHLGYFKTPEEAYRKYLSAKAALHPFSVQPC